MQRTSGMTACGTLMGSLVGDPRRETNEKKNLDGRVFPVIVNGTAANITCTVTNNRKCPLLYPYKVNTVHAGTCSSGTITSHLATPFV